MTDVAAEAGPIVRLFRRWDGYWFGTVSPYPLAAFRIAFGGFLLAYFLYFSTIVTMAFSSQGVYTPFLIPDVAPRPAVAVAIYGVTLALILAFILGVRTRVVTPLLFSAFLYHYLLNLAVKSHSYDRIFITLLFVLCWTELDGAWSVTSRSTGVRQVSAWGQRIICVYVSIVYFGMSAYKISDRAWHDGAMLEANFACEWATPLAFWILSIGTPRVVFDLFTWSTILLEYACAFAFWFPAIQIYFFLSGVTFHLAIALFLNVWEFLFLPTTYLLFMSPERVERLGVTLFRLLPARARAA